MAFQMQGVLFKLGLTAFVSKKIDLLFSIVEYILCESTSNDLHLHFESLKFKTTVIE